MFCCGEKAPTTIQTDEIRVGTVANQEPKEEPKQAEEKPQTLLEQVTEAATQAFETAKEAIIDAKEKVEDKIQDVAEAAGEAVQDAAEAVGIAPHKLTVEFVGPKGEKKSVEFPVKKVGFSMVAQKPGCCGSKAAPGVVLKFVEKESPAAKAGCAAGWKVKSIDGAEVESFSQAEKLMKESIDKLPESQ